MSMVCPTNSDDGEFIRLWLLAGPARPAEPADAAFELFPKRPNADLKKSVITRNFV